MIRIQLECKELLFEMELLNMYLIIFEMELLFDHYFRLLAAHGECKERTRKENDDNN